MLTTTATLLFLLVTSGLAALAVHEFLGSGRSRPGQGATGTDDSLERMRMEIEGEQRVKLNQIETLIGQLRMNQQAVQKESAQHEAAIAIIFQELRNGDGELRKDLEHMNRIMADMRAALAPDDSDLKRIKGIGAALESTLKGLGVETIDQVANLSIDQIEDLSQKLGSFANRIERDHWIEQAQALKAASAIG